MLQNFKHSISRNLYDLINTDPKSRSKALRHINLKEFVKASERTNLLKLFQKLMPDVIDLRNETFI